MAQPIWVLVAELTVFSGSDGAEASYDLDPFDWALQVQNLQYAIEVVQNFPGNGDTNIELDHYESASGDRNGFQAYASNPVIAYFAVGTTLPQTNSGSITVDRLPHGRTTLKIKDGGTPTDPVGAHIRVWSGGKPAA
jgi:hypothetical protein